MQLFLSSVPHWASFEISKADAGTLLSESASLAGSAAGSNTGIRISKDLLPAVARGFQLLSESQPQQVLSSLIQHPRQTATLCELCSCLQMCFGVPAETTPEATAALLVDRVQVSLLATRAGLLQHLGPLCNALATCINSNTDAAGAALLKSSGIDVLATELLGLFVGLAVIWPSECAQFSPALVPVVPAVAALALATLRNEAAYFEGACTCRRDNNSSSSSNDDDDDDDDAADDDGRCICFMRHCAFGTSAATVLRARCVVEGLCVCFGYVSRRGAALPQQITSSSSSSSSVRDLLLVWLALAAQILHKKQQGRSCGAAASTTNTSSSLQQQQQQEQLGVEVAPYHEQMLHALGVAEGVQSQAVNLLSESNVTVLPLLITAMRYALFPSSLFNSSSSSSSSSSSNNSIDVAYDLLLVMLECVALQPTYPTVQYGCIAVNNQFWLLKAAGRLDPKREADLCCEMLWSVLQTLLPAVERAWQAAGARQAVATDREEPAAAAAATALTAAAPAAVTATALEIGEDASYWAAVGPIVTTVTSEMATYIYRESNAQQMAAQLLMNTQHSSNVSKVLSMAVQLHEKQYSQLLEANLRKDMLQRKLHLKKWDIAFSIFVVTAAGDYHNGSQVVSLLVSHLKAVALAMDSSSSSSSSIDGAESEVVAAGGISNARSILSTVIMSAVKYMTPQGDASSSSSSSGETSPEAAAAAAAAAAGGSGWMWVYLMARSLVPVARILQRLQQQVSLMQQQQQQQEGEVNMTASGSSSTSCTRPSSINVAELTFALDKCQAAAAWLRAQGPGLFAAAGAVPGPALQQLLEVQVPLLQQQVKRVASDVEAATSTGTEVWRCLHAPAVAELGQQLEVFGAAVAAQLPVAQCCNYHGCSNFAKHSELELVSGKSCVCGGCKVARYCSRACQVAHYKHWHKAVCKHIAARQLEQEQGQQQQQLQQ